MTYREKTDSNFVYRCPRCGNTRISTMQELRDVVSSGTTDFSLDLASWLSPPQRPQRPPSKRHRTGLRNSISFCVVWVIILSVAYFALTGSAPRLPFAIGFILVGAFFGLRNWRSESKLATNEYKLLMATHVERYRAYLQRRRVWSRLRYCSRCALVIDPVTKQNTSVFEVHELANSSVKGVSLL